MKNSNILENIDRERVKEMIEQLPRKRILVIGESILDEHFYGNAIGLSLDTPTIKLKLTETKRSYGGAANVTENLLALGAQVSFITLLGGDRDASFFIEWKHPRLRVIPIVETDRKTIIKRKIWGSGYNHLELEQLDDRPLSKGSEARVFAAVCGEIDRVDRVVIQDCRHGMLSKEVIESIKRVCQSKGKKVFVNSQTSNHPSNHLEYAGATYISMNLKEIRDIEPNFPNTDLSELHNKLGANFCVTAGKDGAYLCNGAELYTAPTFPVEAVDTSGAGDSFLSALALSERDEDQTTPLIVANAWASISVTKPGTTVPELRELQDMFAKERYSKQVDTFSNAS